MSEAALAADIWRLGRGDLPLDAFHERHGYYGPDEGMVWTRSWREDPGPLHALAASVAARPDVEPGKRARAAAAAREAAQSELLSRLPRARRPVARFLFKQTARQVRNLELGKATYHIALDGCRSAARRLGSDLAARGLLEDPEDVFFLTVAELADPPPGVRELVEFRRARRAEYQAVELPMTFTGVPQPRDAAVFDPSITQVTGIGGGAGIVEGRARVAAEIEDEDLFESGDILVCRTTNPSWTPLFTLVDAVVIDIGSTASHGAIVARELRLPCVINTGNGTQAIRTGDRIRVDGSAGLVTILERGTSQG